MIGNISWMETRTAEPKHEIEVLVYDSSVGQVTTGKFDGKKWSTYEDDFNGKITYWAFLPDSPEFLLTHRG